MTGLHARLREDLATAMRERDRDQVRVLRTLLSAIANAEAQPADSVSGASDSEGPIAGAAAGLGATEVARRDLTEDEVRAVVRAERDERVAAADDLAERGATAAAAELMAEVTFLDRYLDLT